MLNPDDLVAAWVAKLQSITELVEALGQDASIQGYTDMYPTAINMARAARGMKAGSLLVVWNGMGPRRFEKAIYLQHQFVILIRAPESGTTYGTICALIVNGIDPETGLKLLHSKIHASCEPMNLDLPAARRQTLLVSESETLDYFEFTASLMEIGDN